MKCDAHSCTKCWHVHCLPTHRRLPEAQLPNPWECPTCDNRVDDRETMHCLGLHVADDTKLLCEDISQVPQLLADLQDWLTFNDGAANYTKTSVVVFHPDAGGQPTAPLPKTVPFNGRDIKVEQQAVLLGTKITDTFDPFKAAAHRRQKATHNAQRLRGILSGAFSVGLKRDHIRIYPYPSLTYMCSAWGVERTPCTDADAFLKSLIKQAIPPVRLRSDHTSLATHTVFRDLGLTPVGAFACGDRLRWASKYYQLTLCADPSARSPNTLSTLVVAAVDSYPDTLQGRNALPPHFATAPIYRAIEDLRKIAKKPKRYFTRLELLDLSIQEIDPSDWRQLLRLANPYTLRSAGRRFHADDHLNSGAARYYEGIRDSDGTDYPEKLRGTTAVNIRAYQGHEVKKLLKSHEFRNLAQWVVRLRSGGNYVQMSGGPSDPGGCICCRALTPTAAAAAGTRPTESWTHLFSTCIHRVIVDAREEFLTTAFIGGSPIRHSRSRALRRHNFYAQLDPRILARLSLTGISPLHRERWHPEYCRALEKFIGAWIDTRHPLILADRTISRTPARTPASTQPDATPARKVLYAPYYTDNGASDDEVEITHPYGQAMVKKKLPKE